jgi:hypothetical protein
MSTSARRFAAFTAIAVAPPLLALSFAAASKATCDVTTPNGQIQVTQQCERR